MDTKIFLLQDLEREFQLTQIVLERIPTNHIDWKPHEKSMTLGQLSSHVATLPGLMLTILKESELDFSKTPPHKPQILKTQTELLKTFDELHQQVLKFISSSSDKYLQEIWTMRNGNEVFVQATRERVIRWVGLHHLIHHRGELLVYLRLLNIPLPGLYGPSADEPSIKIK